MADTKKVAYSLVQLDEPVKKGHLEFKWAVLRLFGVTYKAPFVKDADGNYLVEERSLPEGSVLFYFMRKADAAACFAAL